MGLYEETTGRRPWHFREWSLFEHWLPTPMCCILYRNCLNDIVWILLSDKELPQMTLFFPQTVYCGVYSLKKKEVCTGLRAPAQLGVAWAWRGRGLGVRGLGVAWAWLGRGLGVAWAWRGRGLGVGVAWAWRGRGLGVAWAWLGRGLGVAWAWRGRGLGVAWAKDLVMLLWGSMGCFSGAVAHVLWGQLHWLPPPPTTKTISPGVIPNSVLEFHSGTPWIKRFWKNSQACPLYMFHSWSARNLSTFEAAIGLRWRSNNYLAWAIILRLVPKVAHTRGEVARYFCNIRNLRNTKKTR